MRNSIISILLLLLVVACDDIPSEVIENNFNGVRVVNLSVPDQFQSSGSEDEFIASVEFNYDENIDSVWYDIFWAADNKEVVEKVYMMDTGERSKYGDQTKDDNIYTGKTKGLNDKSSGRYKLEVFTKDKDQNQRSVAIKYFQLVSSQINVAPVISELSIVDTVKREELFKWTIKAEDGNGLGDIEKVLFFLVRPDGSSIDEKGIPMNDTGDSRLGDEKAGDGIFSYQNTFASTTQTGTWKFTFKAIDKSGAESNIITHNMVVE